jgi:hypothetical protein
MTLELAVIDRSALKDAPPESPVFDQIGKVATISWSRGNHTYLIASRSSVRSDLMKPFLVYDRRTERPTKSNSSL